MRWAASSAVIAAPGETCPLAASPRCFVVATGSLGLPPPPTSSIPVIPAGLLSGFGGAPAPVAIGGGGGGGGAGCRGCSEGATGSFGDSTATLVSLPRPIEAGSPAVR